MLFDEASLRRVLNEFLVHYHAERNRQGNVLLCPVSVDTRDVGAVQCRGSVGCGATIIAKRLDARVEPGDGYFGHTGCERFALNKTNLSAYSDLESRFSHHLAGERRAPI